MKGEYGQSIYPLEGAQLAPEEEKIKSQHELKVFMEGATIGSPKLLALNDMTQWLKADINVKNAERAFKSEPNVDQHKVNLIVAEQEERRIGGEMSHREVSIEGYHEERSEIRAKAARLRNAYSMTGLEDEYADTCLLKDLSDLRKNAIERNKQ